MLADEVLNRLIGRGGTPLHVRCHRFSDLRKLDSELLVLFLGPGVDEHIGVIRSRIDLSHINRRM
jgi:hypothetical protein